MQDCKKFVKMAGEMLIKQQALIMATSDDKGYDLEKYREKVMLEMEGVNKTKHPDTKSKEKCKDTPKKSFEELMYGRISFRHLDFCLFLYLYFITENTHENIFHFLFSIFLSFHCRKLR